MYSNNSSNIGAVIKVLALKTGGKKAFFKS